MASFTAYYNLCPIHDTKEFLGLSRDREEGNIITTLGRNIIIVIKLSNQKQIRSWTILDKLSSKVVYDNQSEQYVGIFGNRYIRCWKEDTLDINKLKKIKFQKNIAALVCTEKDGVLLLYSDGSCESLSCGIESRKNEKDPPSTNEGHSQSVIDANVFICPDEKRLLTYFSKNDVTGNKELITVILDEETLKPIGEPVKYNLSRQDQNASLAGFTVMEGQSSPCLLTIWSDKRIFTMSLTEDTSPKDAPGNFISMLSILNVDHPLSLVGISKQCVAIYGANAIQEGASLILYNTQFKVVKSKQFFKIYFNFSRLWTVKDHILLAMGQNLSVVSFRMSKEMLSELIGSQVSNELQEYIGDGFINEEDELEDILCFNPNPMKSNSKWNDVFDLPSDENAADGKIIPFKSYDDFEKQLNGLSEKNLHVEFITDDKESDFHVNLMTNFHDSGFLTDEIDIIAKELEKRGAGEQEITEKLIYLLIKADNPIDISVCLRRYTNVSERMLAKVLNYALIDLKVTPIIVEPTTSVQACDNNVEKMESDNNVSQENFPDRNIFIKQSTKVRVSEKSDLVNLVLSCSINPETIAIHIRKEVEFDCVMTLLNHLYNLISCPGNCLEERPETSIAFDDDMKILQWFGIILNTHFQDMVLSRDKKVIGILAKWTELLALYRQDLRELTQLAAVLYNVVDKKLIANDKLYSKWYSIEEVKLY